MSRTETVPEVLVLEPDDHHTLGPQEFGTSGLKAVESIGPFVKVQAVGPLIMVHDGRFQPRRGIGHHPHRLNERLFYILEGAVTHDDALNGIVGEMRTGDLGRLTEGRRGMLHREWNDTDGPTRAFILVYATDPTPAEASFHVLRDEDAPRYEEGAGVSTKELVGPEAPFPLHGDIRRYTDSFLEPGARLEVALGGEEGGLLVPVQGSVLLEGADRSVGPGHTVILPPMREPRRIWVEADDGPARILRVAFGPGYGFLTR